MSAKKTDAVAVVFPALKCAGLGVTLTLFLLWGGAALIGFGTVKYDKSFLLCAGIAFLGAAIAAVTMKTGSRGGMAERLAAVVISAFLLAVISAGFNGGKFLPSALLPQVAAIAAGIMAGSIMQNNKKERKRKRKKR